MSLPPETQERLLIVARSAFEARVRRMPLPDPGGGPPVRAGQGAFVTVVCRGELRGCLGRIASDLALSDLIWHLAQVVADSDPRFDPIQPGELEHTRLEISVLTPEREIQSIDQIEIGRHGLIVEHGSRRGLLLPQVAVEHGWHREAFVAHTCVKAGLPADAWRSGVRLLVFEAQVFGEVDV